MIKDIIVHLEHQAARDPARDFAVTIAEIFDAHLAAVAFAYAPDFPGYVMLEIPSDIVAGREREGRSGRDRTFRCRRQAQPDFRRAPPAQAGRGVRTGSPVDTRPAFRSRRVHAVRAERS
jgi:hypothetical protein